MINNLGQLKLTLKSQKPHPNGLAVCGPGLTFISPFLILLKNE